MSKRISLDKLAKGALHELFNRELQAVSANIWNPNTSAAAKRKIMITLAFTPDEDRTIGATDISVKSTLCPVKGVSTKIVFGYNEVTKEGEAAELNTEMLGQISVEEMEAILQEKKQDTQVLDLRNTSKNN